MSVLTMMGARDQMPKTVRIEKFLPLAAQFRFEQLLVDPLDKLGDDREVIGGDGALTRPSAKTSPQLRLTREPEDGVCDRGRIVRLHQEAVDAVLHDVAGARYVGSDERESHRRRFEEHPRNTFAVVGGENEYVRRTEDISDVVPWAEPGHRTPQLIELRPSQCIEALSIVRPDEDEADVRVRRTNCARRCREI